ncbi:MAG: flagellar filament outer layer protein FlaA [Spirochaetota bacterium]
MKRVYKVAVPVCAVVFVCTIVFTAQTAYSKIVTNTPPDISASDVKAVVVEDFEGDTNGWTVSSNPKKFNTSDPNKQKKDPVISLEIKGINGAPADLVPEKWAADGKGTKKDKCLGVHFQFKYPGNNVVYIVPKDPIRFPGRVRGMSLWVQGRGKEYSLEALVEDHTGASHVIKFGSLNYVGWRPLSASISESIPQSIESYPQTKTLKLTRFVLRSSPNEGSSTGVPEEAFFYFDQLKVLSESFEVNFDGQDLDKAFQNGNQQSQPAGK